MKELDWRPIDSAPKDTPILAWCEHSADPYWEEDGMTLTTYGAQCEGLTRVSDGINLVIWGGEYDEGENYIPAWWFRMDSEFEIVANPTHWMPLPEKPYDEGDERCKTDREIFEAWIVNQPFFGYDTTLAHDGDGYTDACVHAAWMGYRLWRSPL